MYLLILSRVRVAVTAVLTIVTLCWTVQSQGQFEVGPGASAEVFAEPAGGFYNYWWLAAGKIVYAKSNQDLDRAYTVNDLATGAERPLIDLNRLMSLHEPLRVMASPDGSRVLWQPLVNLCDVFVATLDGQLLGSYSSRDRIAITAWSVDNKHFLCFTIGSGADARSFNVMVPVFDRVYEGNIGVPGSFKEYEIPIESDLSGLDYLWRGPVCMLPFLQVRADCSALLLNGQPQDVSDGAAVTFEMFDITKSVAPALTYHVSLPPIGKLVDAVISPDGERVAWQIEHKGALELWVGKLSGTDPQYVGKTPTGAARAGLPVNGWEEMRWRPDGIAVSFRWHRNLYVISLTKTLIK